MEHGILREKLGSRGNWIKKVSESPPEPVPRRTCLHLRWQFPSFRIEQRIRGSRRRRMYRDVDTMQLCINFVRVELNFESVNCTCDSWYTVWWITVSLSIYLKIVTADFSKNFWGRCSRKMARHGIRNSSWFDGVYWKRKLTIRTKYRCYVSRERYSMYNNSNRSSYNTRHLILHSDYNRL